MSKFGERAKFIVFLFAATLLVAIVGAIIFLAVGLGVGGAVRTFCMITAIC